MKSALIEAVKAKLAHYGNAIGPATCAPMILIVKANKFERAAIAAMSMKEQRICLANARKALKDKNATLASCWIASYKVERDCYKMLFNI
jgi:hypothetical protein